MLPRNKKSRDMVGHFVRTVRDMRNGAGMHLPQGSIVKITSFGRDFTIKTRACPLCGISGYISHVVRDDVEPINEDNPYVDHYKEIVVVEHMDAKKHITYAGYERTLKGYHPVFQHLSYTLFEALKTYTDKGCFIKLLTGPEGTEFEKQLTQDDQEQEGQDGRTDEQQDN